MMRIFLMLALGVLGTSACSPRSAKRPVLPTLSAPEGAGAWLFGWALDRGVEIPIFQESLLAATEFPLPGADDGSEVLTLTPNGLFSRNHGIAPSRLMDDVLHLLLEEGRKTPEGEIPEAIHAALSSANPGFSPLKPETHKGNRKLYLVADHRTSAASLAAIGLAAYFSGYAPPILVGLSPDGVPRGMRLQGARPCSGVEGVRVTPQKKVMGMDGEPGAMAVGEVTQIGDCKGLERPDWLNRRTEAMAACFAAEASERGRSGGDRGTLTLVLNASGQLVSSSLRSPWAGASPALQQCVHETLAGFRAPVAKGSCLLARDFRFEVGDTLEVDVQTPLPSTPHYGRVVRWGFASIEPGAVLMEVHHEGSPTQCPTTTSASIGWNVTGAERDRHRVQEALEGIAFELEFLGIRILGSMPLQAVLDTAAMWTRKGTRVGLSIRRF